MNLQQNKSFPSGDYLRGTHSKLYTEKLVPIWQINFGIQIGWNRQGWQQVVEMIQMI